MKNFTVDGLGRSDMNADYSGTTALPAEEQQVSTTTIRFEDEQKLKGKAYTGPLPPSAPLEAMVKAQDFLSYNNTLVGKILTIIDATGLQPDAKKAVKNLIKSEMWTSYDWVWRWMNKVRQEEIEDALHSPGLVGRTLPPFPFDRMESLE